MVAKIEEQIKSLTDCYLDWIDENGNIVINLNEISPSVHQEFEITARRKKLRRLEQIAAFNVATQLSCQSDTKELTLPKSMNSLGTPSHEVTSPHLRLWSPQMRWCQNHIFGHKSKYIQVRAMLFTH